VQISSRAILRCLTGAFFVGAGALHFLHPASYMKIMPPYIPAPLAMVYISGAAEIAGGIGLSIPRAQRVAAWGLVALLAAVFPANLYMATHGIQVTAQPLPAVVLWARLPLQALLIWWVLKAGRAVPKHGVADTAAPPRW
jgi:uncharacterized membrane protein